MANQQRFEGPDLQALLDRVRSRMGDDARIIAANRVRKGGVGGFFAREFFEVIVAGPEVPVATDAPGTRRMAGNRLSNIFTSLCTDLADPVARLRAVHDAMTTAKRLHEVLGPDLYESWTQYAPPRPFAWAMRAYSRWRLADRHRPPINVIVSCVAGPRRPLAWEGGTLERLYSVGPLVEAVRALGGRIEELGRPGHVPLRIEGASLEGGRARLDAGESSQYLSALLMAGAAAAAPVTLEVAALTSGPYVEVTLAALERFGARASRQGTVWTIEPSPLATEATLRVEGDFSAAWSGKLKMVFQCAAVVASLLALDHFARYDSPLPAWLYWGLFISVWTAVLSTIQSGVEYLFAATKLLRN